MTFNVSEFSAKVNQYNGLSRPNLFAVRITGAPPAVTDKMPEQDLMFFCNNVDLPAINIVTHDYQKNAFGIVERRPVAVSLLTVPAVFMVDSERRVLDFFHRWLQAMINYDVRGGHWAADSTGRTPYEIAYKEDYVATLEILMYSAEDGTYSKYKMNNCHPIEVGSISLSWDNNDQIAQVPVVFSYESMDVEAAEHGLPSNFVHKSYFKRFHNWVDSIQSINRGNGNFQSLIDNFTL